MTACTRRCVIPVFLTDVDHLEEIVVDYLGRVTRRDPALTQLALYGASFPAIDSEERSRLYRRMRPWVAGEIRGGVRVTADPADVMPDIPCELADGGVRTVELNVCSMDDDVLDAAGRRHTTADTVRAVERLRAAGLEVGARIHPGLPGSSSQEIHETAQRLADLKPDFVRIYPVLVLAGTDLEVEYLTDRYRPLTLPETVSVCKRLLAIFEAARVPVVRIGLQPAVDLPEGGRVVAGPHHPSLRYLVDAARAYDRASRLIADEFRFARDLVLSVPPREESALRGDQGENVTRLKRRFKLRTLRIVADPGMRPGDLRLEIVDPDDVSLAG